MIGGKNGSENPFAYVRYYSITHDAWEVVADLNEARSHLGCAAATTQGETKIYAIGGGDSPNGVTRSSMEVYNVVDDKWKLHEGFLSENGGRTRLGVQNMDNKYLFLIGGDTTCAGSTCPSDQPMSIVEIVRIKDNKLISDSDTYRIPQLQSPRHTPATKLVRRRGNNLEAKYVLFVTAGRTRDSDGLEVLATTETLEFKGINVKNLKNR
jgi:hypothetical protein